jgi:DNA mismatch repair protein MutL
MRQYLEAIGGLFMSVINILPPHLADMIAAGEVVERPASVIKELVENSFDAGARNITVEIRGGGSVYIRVTDDGCGMAPEDAGIAFLRHATSKLADEHGLECISTMGFRGEALAAISAVSHIELRTRRAEDREGTLVRVSAGEIEDMTATGCPKGTTVIVRDLFFNTPARHKFMKSDRSEASACQTAAIRCALAHPDVSVRFIKDAEEVFFSPGDTRISSCIYTVLGRDAAQGMLECAGEDSGLRVTGFISSPSAGRGNRSGQFFFCNGRFIRSALLQSALEQAYRNSLLTGKYPGCVLYLDIPFGSVDVNVHPAKIEVKFSEEKRVFDLVYYSVLSALDGEKKTADIPVSPSTEQVLGRKSGFYQTLSTEEYRRSMAAASSSRKPARDAGFSAKQESYQTVLDLSSGKASSAAELFTEKTPPPAPRQKKQPDLPHADTPSAPKTAENVEISVQNVENSRIPDHKIVGEVFKKYIIIEQGSDVVLIDKHAAHERMIFDRLKEQASEITAQVLLIPVPLRLNGEDAEALAANGELLSSLGFEIEPLDDGNFVVRAVPADMFPADVVPSIEEICEKLRSGKLPDPAEARDQVLHTVACKAAIKAGWDTSSAEMEELARAVLSGAVLYCPHGRPVSLRIPAKDLDKRFMRIV